MSAPFGQNFNALRTAASHRDDGPIHGFERFFNSTFGIPQQVIFRLLRAAQDPNVNLFSEEGLFDKSLVPILGLWDDDRKDVRVSEMVERTNTALGTTLDPESFGAQLGVGILTDPLTFLTGGATALGRGAKILNKAKKATGIRESIEALGKNPSLPAVGKALKESLEGPLTSGARRKAEKAIRELEEGAIGKLGPLGLDDAGKLARDRELRVSAPFFNMAGKALYRTQDASNWVSLVGKRIPGVSDAASALGKRASELPVVSKAMAQLNAIPAGRRAAGLSSLQVAGEAMTKDTTALLDGPLSEQGIALYQRLTGKVTDSAMVRGLGRALDKGQDPDEAMVRLVLGRRPTDPDEMADLAAKAKDILGVEDASEVTTATLQHFAKEHEAGHAALQAGGVAAHARTEGAALREEFGTLAGFKFGEGTTKFLRKVFQSEAPLTSLIEGDKLARSYVARATEAVQGTGKLLNQAARHDAAAMEMDVPAFEHFMLMHMQGDILMDELSTTSRLVGLDGKVTGFADARTDMALRFINLSERVVAFADDRPAIQSLVKPYQEILDSLGDGTRVTAKFDELANVRVIGETPALGGAAANRHVLRVGKKSKAVHLGNMSDSQLETVRQRLVGQATTRNLAGPEVQAVIDDSNMLSGLQKMWTRRARDGKGELVNFGMSPEDVIHNLERAKKGTIRVLNRAKGVGTENAPKSMRLTREQADQWAKAARQHDPEGLKRFTTDVNRLDDVSRTDLQQIEKLQELRAAGAESKMPRAHPSITNIEADARVAHDIFAEIPTSFGTITEGLGESATAIARLMHGAAELRRTKVVTPALLEDLEEAAMVASRAFREPIEAMLEKAGATNYLGQIRKLRGNILSEAVTHGLINSAAPLAYVGRVISRENTKAIAEALGKDEIRNVLQDAMPQMSSSFGRNLNSLPIEDLNELHHVLNNAGDKVATETAALIERAAKEAGLRVGKFDVSPTNILTARLAQAETRYAVAESAAVMLKSAEEAGEILSGRVVRVIRGAGPRVAKGQTAGKKAKTQKAAGKFTSIDIENVPIDKRFSAVVVRAEDGKEYTIPTTSVGNGATLLPLDAHGSARELLTGASPEAQAELLDKLTTAQAFSLRSARGAFDPGSMLDTINDADLAHLDGQHVIFGNKNTVGGMFSATQKQWEHSSELAVMSDNVAFMIKSWQTVYRPAFHIANAAGSYFMARALGVSAGSSAAGMSDAMRFMHGDPRLAAVYDKMSLHLANADGLTGVVSKRLKGVPQMEFLRVIRRAGREGISEVDAKALKEFGLEPEDLVFRAGGQDHHIGELLDVMAREGLFSTFINNGLRGSSSTTEAMFRLRAGVIDKKLFSARLGDDSGTINQMVGTAGEASEAFSRLSVVFAQLRDGVSLEHAVRNAKKATIDYAQITPTERALKRGILYYTFPRHYIPFATKHFAEDPAALARTAQFIKSAGDTGVTTEENGRTILKIPGTALGVDADRLNPNMEVVKLLEAYGEVMLNFGDNVSEVVRQRGSAVAREEQFSGETDQPFGLGTPAELAGSIFGLTRKNPVQVLSDAFWATRIAFSAEDPLGEKTIMTQLTDSVLLGTKHSRPQQHRKVIRARFDMALGNLRKKAQETQDPEYRERLREEIMRLRQIKAEKLSDVRD